MLMFIFFAVHCTFIYIRMCIQNLKNYFYNEYNENKTDSIYKQSECSLKIKKKFAM